MNSSVFAHYHLKQFSDLTEEAQEYMFGYSIRMLVKPEGFFVHGMSFDSCQLYRRHWIIKSNDNLVGDFNGEAVIGHVYHIMAYIILYQLVSLVTIRGKRVCLRMLNKFYCFTWIDRGFLYVYPGQVYWRIHKEALLRLKLLDFLWFCQSTSILQPSILSLTHCGCSDRLKMVHRY
ncbi:putative ApaG domain-containing protein [Helianthus debilis subsp. tardiflorus]